MYFAIKKIPDQTVSSGKHLKVRRVWQVLEGATVYLGDGAEAADVHEDVEVGKETSKNVAHAFFALD